MRVMYVEGAYGFGGSLTGLLHLFQTMPRHVTPILVTCFDPIQFTEMPASLIHEQVDVPTDPPTSGHWLRGVARYYRNVIAPWRRSLDTLVRQYRPDVIHANNSVISNYAVGLVARKHGIPSISHQKGFEHTGRFNRALIKYSPFEHHVATSGAIAKHLYSLGISPERCTTVYEPVIGPGPDDALATPDAHDVPTMVMHSMVVPEKGQHVFLEAVADLVGRNSPPFRAIIAGTSPGGETSYIDSLRAMTQRLGIESVVEFAGHQRDVYGLLASADIAVHAAVDPEPFGRVVAEAMLCGLPTIVTADGGPAEYVQEDTTGFCVPRGDATAMANVLERLLHSPGLRRRVGQAAREYSVTEFEPSMLSRRLVDVYDHLLGTPPTERTVQPPSRDLLTKQ